MSLTDARQMWKLLNEAGTAGVHSHELRRMGISGNPSQRAKDIADHVPVFTAREARGGRPGSRYWLQPGAPDWSVPVEPNKSSDDYRVGSDDGVRSSKAIGLADKIAGSSCGPSEESSEPMLDAAVPNTNGNGGGEPAQSSVKEPHRLTLEDAVLATGRRELTLDDLGMAA